eukprot:8590764-Pyramimonas_sp.AAC.1
MIAPLLVDMLLGIVSAALTIDLHLENARALIHLRPDASRNLNHVVRAAATAMIALAVDSEHIISAG